MAPSMRILPLTDPGLSGVTPSTGDSATPEIPCPPRLKACRSHAVVGSGKPRLEQNLISSSKLFKAQGLKDLVFGGTENVASWSMRTFASPEGAHDSDEDDSDAASDAVSDAAPDALSISEEESATSVELFVQFRRTHERRLPRRAIAQKVFDVICKKALKVQEAKWGEEGFIYILEDTRWPGYVKIGRTSKNPEKRSHLSRRCDMKDLALVSREYYTPIRCYKRLEWIIHTDLWNENYLYPCQCKRSNKVTRGTALENLSPRITHGEWFKVDKEEAMQRIEQWRKWMRQEPYESNAILKPQWQERIESLAKDESYEQTVEEEQASHKWWQSFMERFPDPPPRILQETIEARLDDQDVQWPSRFDCIWAKKRKLMLMYFLVVFLLLSCLLLNLAAYVFPGTLFRGLSYLTLACTKFCWL